MSNFSPNPDAAVYVISVASELTGLHPQTLRTYERLGLIRPVRTSGGGRRYSHRDLELLREIADLTAAGIGIEGVRRILRLTEQLQDLQTRYESLKVELASAQAALQRAGQPHPPQQTHGGHPRQEKSGDPAHPVPLSRLPAKRPPDLSQSVVVWRRGR